MEWDLREAEGLLMGPPQALFVQPEQALVVQAEQALDNGDLYAARVYV